MKQGNVKCLCLILALLAFTIPAFAAAPICPHVIGWNTQINTWAQGAPWIKVIYDSDIIPAQNTGAKVFYRPYNADSTYLDDGNLPSARTGSQYADLVWAKISGLSKKPEAVGYRNEFNWDNPTAAKRTCAEFVNYANRLRQLGYTGQVVFGSFGVGWVDSWVWDDPDCQAATAAADGIETHEYFDLTVDCCSPWLCYRHRDIAIADHSELATKAWYIGEFGSDRVCGNCTNCHDALCRRGWNDNGKLSESAYIAQLDLYSLNCAPQVVAVFLFQQGAYGWYDFEVMGTSVATWMQTTWNRSQGTGTIVGNVKDGGGVNLSGATVSTTTGGYSTTTNSSGNYTLSNVSVGTYSVVASKTGYNSQTQTGKTVNLNQTTTVNFTLTSSGSTIATENFESMPSWSSYFDATWGSAATWSITGGGQSGNFLQVARSSEGSSVKAKVYTVPTNTNITVSGYMKCPSYGGSYWMEFGCKLGSNTAQNFDTDSASWTMIKKFSNSGTNGNGNAWTNYSTVINTGSNTQITVAYKLGSSACAGPTVGWDTFKIEGGASCTPPSITTQPQSQTKTVGQSCTFSVAASGTSPLSYQWKKNGTNISGATSSSYSIASVTTGDAGSYTCYVSNSCGNVTSNAATLTVNSGTIASESFDSVPSWTSSYDASWGSAATWSSVSGGQSGNFLQASRGSQGSSSKVKVYTVPQNTSITVSCYMKCPSYANSYWIEFACKLGSNTAQNFDADANSWTMIKKFSNTGTNGNGNTWTQYSTTLNTGSNTQISIGYKHGASGCTGPTVGWDTFVIQ